jgi:hypothetical protein
MKSVKLIKHKHRDNSSETTVYDPKLYEKLKVTCRNDYCQILLVVKTTTTDFYDFHVEDITEKCRAEGNNVVIVKGNKEVWIELETSRDADALLLLLDKKMTADGNENFCVSWNK